MRHIQNFKAAVLAAITIAGSAITALAKTTIQTVTVGNVGNAADTTTDLGGVGYSYAIGKYEVTNTQYVAFLRAVARADTNGLYNTEMGSSQHGGITRSGTSGSYTFAVKEGFENKPVNFVSFWDAARFANWQSGGSTETGSYTLTSGGISANTVTRNVGANWVVASENEWYKAAYYDPTKSGGAGYWLRATTSDTLGNNTSFDAGNGANFYDGDDTNGGYGGPGTTDVGSYANAASFYGTFDQGGNLWEWNEEIIFGTGRGLRGGAFGSTEVDLQSSFRHDFDPTFEGLSIGFRVVSLATIPEPSTYGAAMGVAALAVVAMRRRASKQA
jgi:formylglycine-generating enzyme